MSDRNMDGYKELWGSVLMQIITDALRVDPSSAEDKRAHRDAVRWMDRPDRDFAMVCTFAGLDPVAVYQAWKGKRIKSPGQKVIADRQFTREAVE